MQARLSPKLQFTLHKNNDLDKMRSVICSKELTGDGRAGDVSTMQAVDIYGVMHAS